MLVCYVESFPAENISKLRPARTVCLLTTQQKALSVLFNFHT